MDAKALILLLGLKSEALKQITIEQRGGAAIPEEELDVKPGFEDFDQDNIKALLPETRLDDLVSSDGEKDPQINMDEAIEDATLHQTPAATQKDLNEKSRPTVREKIRAFLDARREWNIRRMELEYRYECSKQKVIDRTYGFEYMVAYILVVP